MQDFIDKGMEKSNNEKLGLSENDVKGKINRSLHKLANKHQRLAKVPFEGRGFYYALPTWLNPAGELKKKYMVK